MKRTGIFTISLLINAFITNAQVYNTNESSIVAYKVRIVDSIKRAVRDRNLDVKFGENTSIIAVPVYSLNLQRKVHGPGYNWNYLSIDTLEVFAVFKRGNKITGAADKFFIPGYSILFDSDDLFNQYDHRDKMIEFALKYSKNPFFVYFLKDEGGFMDVIGYFNKGTISYIDKDLRRYASAQELVTSRYGCVKKYIELVDDYNEKQKVLTKLKTENIEEVKNIIRNDYLQWSVEFPRDTTKILDLFMAEIDRISALTPQQHVLLKNKIVKIIKANFSIPFNYLKIPFLHSELYEEVRSVLTKEQLNKYLDQRELNLWIAFEAHDQIWRNIKVKPGESVNDTYKKQVFGR